MFVYFSFARSNVHGLLQCTPSTYCGTAQLSLSQAPSVKMPTRVSARSSRSSGPKSKRSSAAEDDIPDKGPTTSLRDKTYIIFNEVQKSNTGHRKLVVGLRKIQEACCYEPTNSKKQAQVEDFDENDFNTEVLRCVLRVLPVKKSEPVGDRIVRFIGLYLKHATELGTRSST